MKRTMLLLSIILLATLISGWVKLAEAQQPGLEGNRGFATDGVEVPDESDVQRARQILEELRARAGERGRPTDELDYIDRLLRRF